MITAIDPGKKALGWCTLAGGRFQRAGLVRLKGKTRGELAASAVDEGALFMGSPLRVIFEYPRVYEGSRSNPDNLLDIVAMGCLFVGALAGSLAPGVQFVRPSEWKGQVPKDAMHRRIRSRLDDAETAALDENLIDVPKSLRHNVLDAVGIALWAAGRMAR